MNDPSSAFNAPPPRYLLESDSSDEEGQGGYPGGSTSHGGRQGKASTKAHSVRVVGSTVQRAVPEAVVGVGQAGRYLFRKLGLTHSAQEAQATVELDGGKCGTIAYVNGAALICLEEQDGEEAWAVGKGLGDTVRAEKWTIVSTYLPSTYIALTASNRSNEPPIRVLDVPNASGSLATWDAPNHLTGIAAALITAANHPAFPDMTNASAIILPLPLSSIRTSDLSSTLTTVCPNLPLDIAAKSSTAKTRWDEQDDEPYSAPGMGRRAAKWARESNARDLQGLEGMYM